MRLPLLSVPYPSRRAETTTQPTANAEPLPADSSPALPRLAPRAAQARRLRGRLTARRALRQGRATVYGMVAQTLQQTLRRTRVISRPRSLITGAVGVVEDEASAAAVAVAVAPTGATLAIGAAATGALDAQAADRQDAQGAATASHAPAPRPCA